MPQTGKKTLSCAKEWNAIESFIFQRDPEETYTMAREAMNRKRTLWAPPQYLTKLS